MYICVKKSQTDSFSLVIYMVFNATFNMFYVYMCAIASYPFLIIAISEYSKNKESDKIN